MKKAVRFFCTVLLVLCTVSLAAEDITLESDELKLVLHEQTSSFSLYRKIGKKGKLVALNEVSGNSSSTGFSIKFDDQFRPLCRSYNMAISTVQNEDGSASLRWEIGRELCVEARFTLISAVDNTPADTVRVDLKVTNNTEEEVVCAMKAVIDTLLGESSRIHFTTARGSSISSEKGFSSMAQDKWITSSNGTESVSVLLAGGIASSPEYVLAASRDLLLSDAWKPVVNEGRVFSTLQNPNNSALGIWFKDSRLKPSNTVTYTFFMTTAENGDVPPNAVLLGIETREVASPVSESATQIVDSVVTDEEYVPVLPASQEKKVDYAYVQELLARISQIEASDNPDAAEIERLSAEIDALILELTK